MPQTHKRRLPIEGLSGTEETLLQMVLTLTSQLSVMRERLDTVETLLARQSLLEDNAIEGFEPSEDDTKRRDAIRQAIIDKVMQPLAVGLEAELNGGDTQDEK